MPIRVFLVEDSPVALQILETLLKTSPDLEIVGTARNGKAGLLGICQLKPDVVCTDLYMKDMDGLELTRQVLAQCPCPILVISVAVGAGHEQIVFQLLQAGAVDVFPKPSSGLPDDYAKQELIQKIKVLAGVKVFTRPLRPVSTFPISTRDSLPKPMLQREQKIVGIGASTGGPQAVFKILSQLPPTFPVPIVCTQHISEGFLDGLITWMDHECPLQVKVAITGEDPQPGVVYYAPERFNLEIDRRGRFIYSAPVPGEAHCPSINVMLRSIASYYGSQATGILLTGMGNDGADGMYFIEKMGGLTIAQDESTSVVFGMPKEAIALGAVQTILPITEMASFLMKVISN